MRTLSAGMQTMLASGFTTLAWAIKITREDGQVFRWVGHDRNAVIDGETYLSAPGFDVSSISSSAGMQVDNLEMTILTDDDITRPDILAGRWDYAAFEISQYDWATPANGHIWWKRGWFGDIKPRLGNFVVELRDLRQALQQDTTAQLQPTCRYRFGDSRCAVDLYPITVSGTITTVDNARSIFRDSSRTEADDYFGEGIVTFTSGLNAGFSAKVRLYESATDKFTLLMPLVYDLSVGDTYTAIPGCRLRHTEDCKTKWNNVINFGGEFHKPSLDDLTKPAGSQ